MEPHGIASARATAHPLSTWLGVLLLAVGFLGHYFAARAIGGTYIAYRDHILGFFFILVVTGAIVAVIGWRYWKGRKDITLLIIGAIQALLGVMVYMQRFSVHG